MARSRPEPEEVAAEVAPVEAPPWGALADALLAREAVLCRIARGVPPDALAGLRIDDDEVDRVLADLLGTLPGGADTGEVVDARPALDATVAAARRTFAAVLATEPSRFGALVAGARLSPEHAEVLALVAAVDLDPRRQRLVGYVQDDVTRRRPTLFSLGRLFGADHAGALAVAESAPLRTAGLVTVEAAGPWADRAVGLHPTVAWALMGDVSPDPDLPPGARVLDIVDPVPDAAGLVLVAGDDPTRRIQVALGALGADLALVVAAPADRTAWDAVIREATLLGADVVVELTEELDDEGRRAITRAGHLRWALTAKIEPSLDKLPDRRWIELRADDDPPTDAEWAAALGEGRARTHPLSAHQLRLVAAALPAVGGDLDAAVRRLAGGRIDSLARRVRPARTWDDLVLPPDALGQLRELGGRYRNRTTVYGEWGFRPSPSAGLVALFSGSSGTGKTLSAEILAGDLGLDLFKLDLSAVVSKYIGETEQNLEAIFTAAASGNLVLFFDEADSLFGKRSEVSDAHDRYANIETSYLLQRLETYDGVVILATNFQKNIDTAFLRRIHAVIEFPTPEAPERRAIWAQNLGTGAPLEGIDLDLLAERFAIAGGSIRNAALTAAFLAAELGSAVTMPIVLQGVVREYRKLGRLITPTDFEPWYDQLAGEHR